MIEIYSIRHAQACFGSENYDRLSELGVKQAQILGDYLSDIGVGFDAIYSGSQRRQIETARKCISRLMRNSKALEAKVIADFDEFDSAALIRTQLNDMASEDPSLSRALEIMYSDRNSFQRVFERAMQGWIAGNCDDSGVETWQAFILRVRAGLKKVLDNTNQRQSIAIFTSGGVISAIMQIALGFSDEETIRLGCHCRNTSLSVFHHNGKRLFLKSFNSLAHLEAHHGPELITHL